MKDRPVDDDAIQNDDTVILEQPTITGDPATPGEPVVTDEVAGPATGDDVAGRDPAHTAWTRRGAASRRGSPLPPDAPETDSLDTERDSLDRSGIVQERMFGAQEGLSRSRAESPRHEGRLESELVDTAGATFVDRSMVTQQADHELVGMTVGDGFRFGCGFVLAMTIGILALLIVLTAFVAVGAILGIKIPVLG